MDRILVEFIKALRGADVRISTSEAIDAIHAAQLVGYGDKAALKTGLGVTLAKSQDEKQAFDDCFDQFFQFNSLQSLSEQALQEDDPTEAEMEAALLAANSPPDSNAMPGDSSPIQSPANSTAQPGQGNSPLAQMLMSGDRNALAMAMAAAGQQANVAQIRVMTQKGLYGRRMMMAMGLEALEEQMWAAEQSEAPEQRQLGAALRNARDLLRQEVKEYVERQLLLQAAEEGKRLRRDTMMQARLENLCEFKDVQLLVRKLAKRLAATHSRRRKVHNRGQLNMRSTLRQSVPHDGIPFNIKWKTKRVDRPKVMAICDVSGSVSQVSRFLLMFLYSLTDVLPRVRAFAFSSRLGEVTDWFKDSSLNEALDLTLSTYGGGSTDYGGSLQDFADICLNDIDNKTTIIMLGDARNNYGDPRTDLMKAMYERSKQVIWLNPENRLRWGSGDSDMKRYLAYCTIAEECNSLRHLERVISQLLRRTQ